MSDQDGTRTAPRRIRLRELRGNLTSVLHQAQQGTTFVVISRNEVLAKLHPPPAIVRPTRRPGALRGQIRMADDFDPLPPDVLGAMEDGQG